MQPWNMRLRMCVLRCYFNAVESCPPVEKFVFCLTGPYLTRRATIGRQANGPLGLAEGGARLILCPGLNMIVAVWL
jgi:hypothetical protein